MNVQHKKSCKRNQINVRRKRSMDTTKKKIKKYLGMKRKERNKRFSLQNTAEVVETECFNTTVLFFFSFEPCDFDVSILSKKKESSQERKKK